MRVLNFKDYDDLAEFIIEIAEVERKVVYTVLFYDEARELLKSLMMCDDTMPCNIELSEPMCKGYDKEFYVVVDNELSINVEEAHHETNVYHEEGYYLFGDDEVIALFDVDVDDGVIDAGEGSFRFNIVVDEEPDHLYDIDDDDFNDFVEYLYKSIFED